MQSDLQIIVIPGNRRLELIHLQPSADFKHQWPKLIGEHVGVSPSNIFLLNNKVGSEEPNLITSQESLFDQPDGKIYVFCSAGNTV